jgi:pimeloyl-ACP methyl ester carboxylesterase
VLADAVGIEVEGHPVADVFSMTLPEIMQRSYYDPQKFRVDPSTLSDAQRAAIAGNRAALAIYGGKPTKTDPTLRERIHAIAVPTLVLWGEADRIVDTAYGRAWLTAIPGAQFKLLAKTGHVPLVETPEPFMEEVFAFADACGSCRGSR